MAEISSSNPAIVRWLKHIKYFAVEIGPRGSTRAGERTAAEYSFKEMQSYGLQPVLEKFKSARSIFQPHLLGSLLMLLAFAIYPLNGMTNQIIAALLSALVLVSEVQELGLKNNLFRMIMPKGTSQNAFSIIPPAAEHKSDLVLVGHLDSQRTPLIFRTPTWVKIYDRFTTITFITFIFQTLVYILSIAFPWHWVWLATIPSAVCALLLAAMCIQADLTPFTAGANDNATAAGMVLTLAEDFAKKPLKHTRVYAVCTGCEEVQHYGMIDFYKRHKAELIKPHAVVLEMLGCAGPSWLTQEGIIVPFKPDADLRQIAEELAKQNPHWEAHPGKVSGGNTEMADAVRAGVPAITFMGMKPEGEAPYWHQKQDTFDKMDPKVMENTWEMVNAFIKELDR